MVECYKSHGFSPQRLPTCVFPHTQYLEILDANSLQIDSSKFAERFGQCFDAEMALTACQVVRSDTLSAAECSRLQHVLALWVCCSEENPFDKASAVLDCCGWAVPALVVAVHCRNLPAMRLLLEAKANVHTSVDDHGLTPLHHACADSFLDGVNLLLKHGANPLQVRAKQFGCYPILKDGKINLTTRQTRLTIGCMYDTPLHLIGSRPPDDAFARCPFKPLTADVDVLQLLCARKDCVEALVTTPINPHPELATESPLEVFARFRQSHLFKGALDFIKRSGNIQRLLELQKDVKTVAFGLSRSLVEGGELSAFRLTIHIESQILWTCLTRCWPHVLR